MSNVNITEVIVERSKDHVLFSVEQRNSFNFAVIMTPELVWNTIRELTTQVVLLEQEMRIRAAENPTLIPLEGTEPITESFVATVEGKDDEEETEDEEEEEVQEDTALAAALKEAEEKKAAERIAARKDRKKKKREAAANVAKPKG